MIAVNESRGLRLAARVEVAATFFARLRGLLGRDALAEGDALLIAPCGQVHTLGMRFAIDVLFLDEAGRALRCERALRPGRISARVPGARRVLELPAGTLETTGTRPGDLVVFSSRSA